MKEQMYKNLMRNILLHDGTYRCKHFYMGFIVGENRYSDLLEHDVWMKIVRQYFIAIFEQSFSHRRL